MAAKGKLSERHLFMAGLCLCALGIILSFYSLAHHHAAKESLDTGFACNIGSTFSCDRVARSPLSEDLLGHPAGLYGLGYFFAVTVLLLLGLRSPSHRAIALGSYGFMILTGVGVSAYMAFLSVYFLNTICLTCAGLYSICFLQLILGGVYFKPLKKEWTIPHLQKGAIIATSVVAMIFLIYQPFKPKPSQYLENLKAIEAKSGDPLLQETLEPQKTLNVLATETDLGPNYHKGADDAVVVITEFIDFECPHCNDFNNLITEVMAAYPEKIKVIFRNFPMDQTCNERIQRSLHESACKGAVMARCLGERGKFWEFNDYVQGIFFKFGDQTQTYIDFAEKNGLTKEEITACQQERKHLAKIKEDIELGFALGVKGTPGIFIGGQRFKPEALSPSNFKKVVETLLAKDPPQ